MEVALDSADADLARGPDALPGQQGLEDLGRKVKIMVGGAPVTQTFCDQIGADRYTSDAASAADAAVQMLS